jgi:lipoyl(octanoyl) transferase
MQPETVTIEQARSAKPDERLRPICFASLSPYEFMHDNRKLDGICQIRRRDAIAYQAAIYNRLPVEPLIASLNHESDELRKLRTEWLNHFATDMATVRGQDVDFAQLEDAIAKAVSTMFEVPVERGDLTEIEISETQRLIEEKYGNDEWTFRR